MRGFQMKIHILIVFSSFLLFHSCNEINKKSEPPEVLKRIGMVIGIKPERIDEYKKLHADSYSGVRDLLNKYNMHNFSIFIKKFDDNKYYLFGYYEYTGKDFEKDMASLAKEQRNIDWLKVTDPIQIPFNGADSWSTMEQVYYNK
jgi:L-rhamnose mutarotase